jgi:hypothetical protein
LLSLSLSLSRTRFCPLHLSYLYTHMHTYTYQTVDKDRHRRQRQRRQTETEYSRQQMAGLDRTLSWQRTPRTIIAHQTADSWQQTSRQLDSRQGPCLGSAPRGQPSPHPSHRHTGPSSRPSWLCLAPRHGPVFVYVCVCVCAGGRET